MPRYEYKVVPAPVKGLKAKGVKGPEARFAHAVQELMNGLSGYGWEYLRAETLPSIERAGLTGSTTEWRNVLVFRRLREGEVDAFAPELLAAPAIAPVIVPVTAAAAEAPDAPEKADKADNPAKDDAKTTQAETDTKVKEAVDNGVEDTGDIDKVSSPLENLAKARKDNKSDS